MKTIYLVRHSKAEQAPSDSPDKKRRLTKRGKSDASRMSKQLARDGFVPGLIVSSPARRAIETARIFAKTFKSSAKKIVRDDTLYSGSDNPVHEEFLNIVRGLDDSHNSVMIVGHEPKMSEYASCLRRDFAEAMPTSAIACFDVRNLTWAKVTRGRGTLKFVDYPNKAKQFLADKRKNLQEKIVEQLTKIVVDSDSTAEARMKKAIDKAGKTLAKLFFAKQNADKLKN